MKQSKRKIKKAAHRGPSIFFCSLSLLLLLLSGYFLRQPSQVYRIRHWLFNRELTANHLEQERISPPSAAVPTAISGTAESTAPDSWEYYPLADILAGRTAIERSQAVLLINAEHPLPADFIPELEVYPGTELSMQREMIEAFRALSAAVRENFGETLYIASLYRSHEEQQDIYDSMSDVAQLPGASEHESGLAADVYTFEHAGPAFIGADPGRWVNANCWRYGFIVRYPEGREDITGIPFEPWHLRYIGLPHAEILTEQGWVLEEYASSLKEGELYKMGEYFVMRQSGPEIRVPAGARELKLSPDNLGSYILSGKRNP